MDWYCLLGARKSHLTSFRLINWPHPSHPTPPPMTKGRSTCWYFVQEQLIFSDPDSGAEVFLYLLCRCSCFSVGTDRLADSGRVGGASQWKPNQRCGTAIWKESLAHLKPIIIRPIGFLPLNKYEVYIQVALFCVPILMAPFSILQTVFSLSIELLFQKHFYTIVELQSNHPLN